VLCIGALATAAGIAACGGSSSKADVSTAFNKSIKTTILVDNRGRTLYMFGLDGRNGTPTCTDDSTYHCSKAWPPLLAKNAPKAGKNVNAALLKTIKRQDGTMQVTYNGYALYTFNGYHLGNAPDAAADTKAGDLHGQGYISSWWVLSPAGKPLTAMPSA